VQHQGGATTSHNLSDKTLPESEVFFSWCDFKPKYRDSNRLPFYLLFFSDQNGLPVARTILRGTHCNRTGILLQQKSGSIVQGAQMEQYFCLPAPRQTKSTPLCSHWTILVVHTSVFFALPWRRARTSLQASTLSRKTNLISCKTNLLPRKTNLISCKRYLLPRKMNRISCKTNLLPNLINSVCPVCTFFFYFPFPSFLVRTFCFEGSLFKIPMPSCSDSKRCSLFGLQIRGSLHAGFDWSGSFLDVRFSASSPTLASEIFSANYFGRNYDLQYC